MSNALDNAAKIDAIVTQVRTIVATVLGIDEEEVLETQESDEVEATRGYVSADASNLQPLGPCNYQFPIAFTIGFQVPDDGRRKYTQRLEWAFKLIQPLTANDALPGYKLILPADMAISGGNNEPHGYLWGGLTLTGSTDVKRGA